MTNLNQQFKKTVQEIPQQLLRRLVEKKLTEQGFHDNELVDAVTEHILSTTSESFHWDVAEGAPTESIVINFTAEDAEQFESDLKTFVEKSLPTAIREIVKEGAKHVVKSLDKNWREVKLSEQNAMQYFRDRIDLRWGAGLDPLRMILISAREIGQAYADRLARSKAKTGLIKRQAIALLHIRACQTALEILTLLESGLADGADARWRTLYEISVVAFVIDRFGDPIAERYLAHDVVSMHESVVNEFRHYGKPYEPEKLVGEQLELEEEFQAAIAKFGKAFSGPYGWAAHHLDKKKPRFQDLEEAVNWNALPPDYKWSSHKIHAGIAGTVRTLGSIGGGGPFIYAGATNAGLEVPAINTAFSLLHVTSLVFGRPRDLETQIQMQSLVVLRDKVARECRRAAKKLEKEEIELQSGYD